MVAHVSNGRLSGQSSCPRRSNSSGILVLEGRVQRLDRINANKPAKLLDFKSLTLDLRSKLIWPVFLVFAAT